MTVKPAICRTRQDHIIKLLTRRFRRPRTKQVDVQCLEGGRKEEKSFEGEDGEREDQTMARKRAEAAYLYRGYHTH
jgi:hypothetical protein